jgi:pyruvate/2-oxoglutarate dehydrogenase complex dihydrolipoamide acyltransferase (E2) component
MLPVVYQPNELALLGAVLPESYRMLFSPRAGHVEQVYITEGQTVRPGDLLLKLAVGHNDNTKMVLVLAPGAGEVVGFGVSLGAYLPAGAAYAHLTRSSLTQVQVVASAATHLAVSDTLHRLAAPAELCSASPVLAAMLPAGLGASPGIAIVVL